VEIKSFLSSVRCQDGHTLEDQIGGQLDAGFVLTGFFEDRHAAHALSNFLATF
jgi:hypothetical protein